MAIRSDRVGNCWMKGGTQMKKTYWVALVCVALAVSSFAFDPGDISTFEPGQLYVSGKTTGNMFILQVSLKQMNTPYKLLGIKAYFEPSHTLLLAAFEPSIEEQVRRDFLAQSSALTSVEVDLSDLTARVAFPAPTAILRVDTRIRVEYLISMNGIVSTLLGMDMGVQDLNTFSGSAIPPSEKIIHNSGGQYIRVCCGENPQVCRNCPSASWTCCCCPDAVYCGIIKCP